jgi:DNA-binding XRE family transcriptional regulator
VKLSDMIPLNDVIEEHRQDPQFREQWDRTEFGRRVAIALVRYRADHNLTQQGLGDLLGVHQPAIARLESGEKNPTLKELARITSRTGLTFRINVADGNIELDAAA